MKNKIYTTFITLSISLALAISLIPGTSAAFASESGERIQGASASSTEYRTIELSWDAVELSTEAEPGTRTENEPGTEAELGAVTVEEPGAGVGSGSENVPGTEDTAEPESEDGAEAEPEAASEVVYSIYRATSKSGKYKVVATTTDNYYADVKLTAGKKYFYKIGAQAGDTVYPKSKAVSATVLKQKKAVQTLITKGEAFFDYRTEAGEKLYKYDTLQGACANDGFGYFSLYNRTVEKCKIVKVNMNTLEVVKVSGPLKVYHANNLSFNTKKNLIAATCCKVKKNRVVFVDPETLTVVSHKDIKLTSKVKGLPSKIRKRNQGFTAIAYNEDRDCYVGRLRDGNNAIIFDGELNPIKYVKLSGKKTYLLAQGIESTGDYIYDVRSFKGRHKYSMVTIHTMSGKLVGQLKFAYGKGAGNELQCIFHDGDTYYAGFYITTSQYHDNKAHHVQRDNKIYYLDAAGLGR
ncbi:MAG: hypothetical protein Q4A65_01650 [Bacillota bacterium]|nr:hypothetical protein [Bacillota bacterium]